MEEGRAKPPLLFVLAAVVVIVAGLKHSPPLMLQFIGALFLAILCIPPMRRLQSHGVPSGLAVLLVIIGATGIVLVLGVFVGRSIAQFEAVSDSYKARLDELVLSGLSWLEAQGLELSTDQLASKLDSGAIIDLTISTAAGLGSALGNIFVVFLIMVFMLLEANDVPTKLRSALGNPDADLSNFSVATDQVQKYMAIKALVSGATGILATAVCWACGVDFPLLWGLVAFLFNFVPNIGSIIAAVPPVLLALIQYGSGRAAIVAGAYFLINMVIGNAVEPRMMGRRLGLSTLVVFLSLLFWEWVWGPVGMLLSVPLTVIVKIILEHTDDFRSVGIMLGTSDEPAPRAVELPDAAQLIAMDTRDISDGAMTMPVEPADSKRRTDDTVPAEPPAGEDE